MSQNKTTGGILIIAGTTIGGGMLALPLASAFGGFWLSSCVLVAMWGLMTYTALLTLEMNLYFHKGVSIAYVAERALGAFGKRLSTLAIGLLFYALLSAYMAGGASIAKQIIQSSIGLDLSTPTFVLIFGAIFSGIIVARTHIVDRANRWLLMIKAVCFVAIVVAIVPNTQLELLETAPTETLPILPVLVPLFFTSFGFHGSIPTIVNYIGTNTQKLRTVFIIGSLIPLGVYLLWELVTLGSIPLEGAISYTSIKNAGGDVGLFTKTLAEIAGGGWIIAACQGFTFLAIATSFLGVGIGLFDFVEEQLKSENTNPSTFFTWSLTFGIPLMFALFYPQGFIMALGYAAIALSILAIIIPTLAVWKLRETHPGGYQVWGGRPMIVIALCAGIGVIILEMFAIFK